MLLKHKGNSLPAGIECGRKVGAYDIVPLLIGHILEESYVGYPGIVHQNIKIRDAFEQFSHI